MNLELHGKSVTYQEIIRQQKGWKIALKELELHRENHKRILEKFHNRVWVFSGCGTSYYLAQSASALFEWLTGIRAHAVPASEILIYPQLVFNNLDEYLMIPISRSGTTTEIVKAAQKARTSLNIPTLAVSCDPDSTLSAESEYRLTFPFERERSVVMTGSFTTMLLSVVYLASVISPQSSLPAKIQSIASDSAEVMNSSEPLIREIVSRGELQDFVFLGQGPFQGLANEAALKMQEMTLSVSQSFHSLEYRHGPKSTANEKTLITLLLSQAGKDFEQQLAKELKQLGARVLGLVPGGNGACEAADYQVEIPPDYGDIFAPFFYMPVLQLLAYYKAISKKINPDQPKNLTAVVKLEI